MKAAVIAFGTLVIEERPDPIPGLGELNQRYFNRNFSFFVLHAYHMRNDSFSSFI